MYALLAEFGNAVLASLPQSVKTFETIQGKESKVCKVPKPTD